MRGKPRKTESDYHKVAARYGLKWVGETLPSNVMTKTLWQCSEGHIFEMKYNHVDGGHGCKECAGNTRKTPEDYRILARGLGLEWLGPEVENSKTLTLWRCSCGIEWRARYNDIASGKKCKVCGIERRATSKRKPPDSYRRLAKARNLAWLGPEVNDVNTPTLWKCSRGHIWETSYGHVNSGRECATCSKERVAEGLRHKPEKYIELAESKGFKWLGPEVPDTSTKTWWLCPKGHRRHISYSAMVNGTGCRVCSDKEPRTPKDYHKLARKRKFIWLGPEVSSVQVKTWWRCPESHEWDAPYTSIASGRGCRFCAKQKRADGKRRKVESYRAIAQKFNLEWLGPEVRTTHAKTFWRCQANHEFDSSYAQIASGKGCRYCAGNIRKVPEDYRALAQENDLIWLGPEVPNVKTSTWWGCQNGHRWEAQYSNIKAGRRCPICGESQGEKKNLSDFDELEN